MEIEKLFDSFKWRFAKTYANSNPHEYIVRDKDCNNDVFDSICEYIKKNGHYEYFYNHKGIYISVGNFTYWIDDNILNRRWNDMYYVEDKKIYKVENWRELLKDGRVLHK